MISFWHFVPRTTSAVNICFQMNYARRSWGKKKTQEKVMEDTLIMRHPDTAEY